MKTVKNLIAFVCMALLPLCAQAVMIGYQEGGTQAGDDAGFKQLGFEFTVTQNITVTNLSFFGLNMGGGDQAQVTLNDVTLNTQLANSGNLLYGPVVGWTNATLATPVNLTPGDVYEVTAPAYWTHVYNNTSGFIFGTGISPIGFYKDNNVGGWADTAIATTPTATPYIAANFGYEFTAVPEPSTVGMLLIGAGIIVAKRKRAQKPVSR